MAVHTQRMGHNGLQAGGVCTGGGKCISTATGGALGNVFASDSELELPRPAAISRVLNTGGSTTSRLHHMQSYLRLLMPPNDKRHAVPLFPCVPSYNRPTHPGGDKKTGTASPTVVRDGRAPHDRIPTERNPLPRNTPRRRRYRLAVGPTRSPRPLPT